MVSLRRRASDVVMDEVYGVEVNCEDVKMVCVVLGKVEGHKYGCLFSPKDNLVAR